MKCIPKLFIDTSVFNLFFDGKNGQKQKDSIRLFEEIAKGRYEAYASQEVLDELREAPEEKRKQMLDMYGQYIKKAISATPEARLLAELYIRKRIIPEKYRNDSLCIAIATVNNFDFVISFNQGHIVKTKTMIGTGFVNLRQGFKQIGLGTPTEVLEYDP